MLIEALDALLPYGEENQRFLTGAERECWALYWQLRSRLKGAVHMSFYDSASGWLDAELRRERIALTDVLNTRLAAVLRNPAANRKSVCPLLPTLTWASFENDLLGMDEGSTGGCSIYKNSQARTVPASESLRVASR